MTRALLTTAPTLGLIAMLVPGSAVAADLYVDATAGPGGDGSLADPFVEIQDALDVAVASDVIHVLPGTYAPIATVSDGTAAAPITVVAEPAGEAIVQADGTALEAHHEYVTIQGLIFDGGYGSADAVDADGAAFLELLDVEVRRSGADCIDLRTTEGVLIANSSIHHCVAATDGAPSDAHGITGDSVFDLEVRDTEIYLFSGDAVQMSPPREPWNDLRIRRCTLWSGALDEDAGPIVAGTVIGENALDTKVGPELDGSGSRPQVLVEDTVAYGFRDSISNQAAYNVKEEVDVLIDRVTVYDSELAFRLRGPARVVVQNAVVHEVDAAVRYEDALTDAAVLASTFGGGVVDAFADGGGGDPVNLTVENLLVLGDAVPDEAAGGMANLAVGPEVFEDADAHDYRLRLGSMPVDAGVDLPGVGLDRNGVARPVGAAFDVGAHEWTEDDPPGGTGGLDDTGGDESDGGGTQGGTSDPGASEGSTGDGASATGTEPGATGFDMGGAVSGCGCRSDRGGRSAAPLALLLLALGRSRRRRIR